MSWTLSGLLPVEYGAEPIPKVEPGRDLGFLPGLPLALPPLILLPAVSARLGAGFSLSRTSRGPVLDLRLYKEVLDALVLIGGVLPASSSMTCPTTPHQAEKAFSSASSAPRNAALTPHADGSSSSRLERRVEAEIREGR